MDKASKRLTGKDRFERDDRLWVRIGPLKEKRRISYNPHTFPGRFAVVNGDGDTSYVGISDIYDCSLEAEFWIRGFLSGSEPHADRMFGEEIWEADLEDTRWSAWRDALDEYHRTGKWDSSLDIE